jgi:hypothetical protein
MTAPSSSIHALLGRTRRTECARAPHQPRVTERPARPHVVSQNRALALTYRRASHEGILRGLCEEARPRPENSANLPCPLVATWSCRTQRNSKKYLLSVPCRGRVYSINRLGARTLCSRMCPKYLQERKGKLLRMFHIDRSSAMRPRLDTTSRAGLAIAVRVSDASSVNSNLARLLFWLAYHNDLGIYIA